jgi:hypothetical protein
MKCKRGVLCEKGAVKKKPVFSPSTIVGGKQAFNTYNIKHDGELALLDNGDV